MAIIDSDMLESDTEMLFAVNPIFENLPSSKKSGQHQGHICSKICLSESGFSRHLKSRHLENLPPMRNRAY